MFIAFIVIVKTYIITFSSLFFAHKNSIVIFFNTLVKTANEVIEIQCLISIGTMRVVAKNIWIAVPQNIINTNINTIDESQNLFMIVTMLFGIVTMLFETVTMPFETVTMVFKILTMLFGTVTMLFKVVTTPLYMITM